MITAACRENVYDLSALITVLGYLEHHAAADLLQPGGYSMAAEPQEPEDERRRREAVVLTSYSADLNTRPQLEQIYDALDAVDVQTDEDYKKARDARTWADILGRGVQ